MGHKPGGVAGVGDWTSHFPRGLAPQFVGDVPDRPGTGGRGSADRLRNLRQAPQLPGCVRASGHAARSRGRRLATDPLRRREDVHVHGPNRLRILTAATRARDRRDVQARDRAQPAPEDGSGRHLGLVGHRRCRRLPIGQGCAHLRHRSRWKSALDHACRARPRLSGPDCDARFVCRSSERTDQPEGRTGHAVCGSLLHRRVLAESPHRPQAEPQLPRVASPPLPRDPLPPRRRSGERRRRRPRGTIGLSRRQSPGRRGCGAARPLRPG